MRLRRVGGRWNAGNTKQMNAHLVTKKGKTDLLSKNDSEKMQGRTGNGENVESEYRFTGEVIRSFMIRESASELTSLAAVAGLLDRCVLLRSLRGIRRSRRRVGGSRGSVNGSWGRVSRSWGLVRRSWSVDGSRSAVGLLGWSVAGLGLLVCLRGSVSWLGGSIRLLGRSVA